HITREIAEDSIQQKAVLYDKEGDYHYDVISAFIKSIRGSDPDATLYWMAKMIHSGEAPHYLFRRMLISASEDIGLADPQALGIVEAAAAAFDRVGLPEGNFHLAQAALYLATAPKSNSALGYFDALEAVAREPQREVPNHLRDASRDKEGFGHGEGYLYPHAYRDHWVAQAYLPGALQGRIFYQPSDQGYEREVELRVARNRELQIELAIPEQTGEVLSYSEAGDRRIHEWIRRSGEDRATAAGAIRDRAHELLRAARHHRVLLVGRSASLHLWESVRSAPEGRVVALLTDKERVEMARHYAEKLPEIERPLIALLDSPDTLDTAAAEHDFDRLLLADAQSTAALRSDLPARAAGRAAAEARIVVTQRIPRYGQRLSSFVRRDDAPEAVEALEAGEHDVFEDSRRELVNWDEHDLEDALARSGWDVESSELVEISERRLITGEQIDSWLNAEREDGLGASILRVAGRTELEAIRTIVGRTLAGQVVPWKTVSAMISGRRATPG
ncbi:MAG TPA: AAA family ATPase, partial [Spirochaetia bacterium]|nr:AAA family ATPase [Spirochaetia bacterium]